MPSSFTVFTFVLLLSATIITFQNHPLRINPNILIPTSIKHTRKVHISIYAIKHLFCNRLLKSGIAYFDYRPEILQTNNGAELTQLTKTTRIHPLDVLFNEPDITHRRIHLRTPRHNEKLERNHRNNYERVHTHISFYKLQLFGNSIKAIFKQANNIPMQVSD